MRVWALLSLALLLPISPAQAADVRVLSGEHDGFSRLVFLLPKGTRWSLRETSDLAVLDVEDPELRYLLGSVFTYIPKTRITAVEQVPGSANVRIETADTVSLEAFELQSGAVVIDVKDVDETPSPEQLPAPVAENSPSYRPPAARQGDLSLYWRNLAPTIESKAPAAPPVAETFAVEDPRVKQAEAELLQQLGRAAAQGLIRVAPPRPPVYDLPVSGTPEAPQITDTQEKDADPVGDHLALHSETSIDRDWAALEASSQISDRGLRCAADPDFDLSAWRGEGTPAELIGAGRRELLGEFDLPRPDAVIDLARSYVAIGFGAEALQLLAAYPEDDSGAQSIVFIAKILDSRPVDGRSPLLKMTDCEAKVALWSLLGASEAPDRTTVRLGAVQRAFAALPAEVRAIVGPQLVDRLIEMGARDVAASIRAALVRASGDHENRVGLIDAQLERAAGNDRAADAHLEPLMSQNSEEAAQAVVALINGRLVAGQPIDDATIAQSGALAFELGHSQTGLALRRAHVLGLGSVGKFDTAFEAIERWKPEWDQAPRTDAVNGLFDQIAHVPDDELLLSSYFKHRDALREVDLPRTTGFALAERLVGLGFTGAGRELLARQNRPSDPERLLLAKAALAERDAPAALIYLSALSDKEAARLRGTALRMLGEHAAAFDEFEKAENGDLARDEAWRSGDWDQVMRDGSQEQKDLLSAYEIVELPATTQTEQTLATPPGPLTRANALLARSAAERKALADLLAQYPLPNAAPADQKLSSPGF